MSRPSWLMKMVVMIDKFDRWGDMSGHWNEYGVHDSTFPFLLRVTFFWGGGRSHDHDQHVQVCYSRSAIILATFKFKLMCIHVV